MIAAPPISNLQVVGGFLLPVECALLCDFFEHTKDRTQERDFAGFPVLRHPLFDVPVRLLAQRICEDIRRRVQDNRRLAERVSLYEETVIITGTGPGGHHVAHADNEMLVDGVWKPNHTPNRVLSSIVYLNSDFTGGLLRFPDLELSIKPEAGLMVCFLSDRHYVHEVTRVESGVRYSMPIWFTDKADKQIRW